MVGDIGFASVEEVSGNDFMNESKTQTLPACTTTF
jgi:hypothetical protein